MPAAAVIPAPIAYIKVVAVKKLVVGYCGCSCWSTGRCVLACLAYLSWLYRDALTGCGDARTFTLRKLECLKQAVMP